MPPLGIEPGLGGYPRGPQANPRVWPIGERITTTRWSLGIAYGPTVTALALSSDYATARDDFLERAALAGATIDRIEHPARGPDDEVLATDVAWIGPADASRVVVVVSGTHGVEGFAGSALQRTWLRDGVPGRPDDVAVCLVHALNPHGFAWVRRVNEDNVDLNRNFVDFEHPPSNAGYDDIAHLLVPPTWDDETQAATTTALLEIAGEVGFETLQQWASGGQYTHPTGIFYGGAGPVWSHRNLDALVSEKLVGREVVAIIDLHTGLGPWGVGELISSDAPGDPQHQRAVDWYGNEVTSLTAGDSVSAELAGEWLPHVASLLHDSQVTAVALEYGTVDVITVLQALRADAWLHAYGDPTGPDGAAIKADVRRAFADDDPAWIERLAERFDEVIERTWLGMVD